MASLGYVVYLVSASSTGARLYGAQAGGGSVHIWGGGGGGGAFHSGVKSPLVLPDKYRTGELYRGILQNILVSFARQHFGDNYRYQDDNTTPHQSREVLDILQRGNVTKME